MDVLKNHPALAVVLVLAAVGYVIVRRWSGEPLIARALCTPPLILTGIGGMQLLESSGLSAFDICWGVAGVLLGFACGAWRGTTVALFPNEGVLWQRYTWSTFTVWIVSLVISGVFAVGGNLLAVDPRARPLALAIGIGLLGEMATVGVRALATGVDFAPQTDEDRDKVHRNMKATLRGRGAARDQRIDVPNVRDSLAILAARRQH